MDPTDRDVLLALYRWAVVEAHWFGWDTDVDISSWRGVEVNDDGRVVALVLDMESLEGIVRPTLNPCGSERENMGAPESDAERDAPLCFPVGCSCPWLLVLWFPLSCCL